MPKTEQEAPSLSLTTDQLQQLLTAAVSATNQQQSEQFNLLVNAIIDSRKPYIDPKDTENAKAFQESFQEQEEFKRRAVQEAQSNCPHIKGATGSMSMGQSAFWIHRLDTGETIGICSQCSKVISSLSPVDQEFFRRRGDNQPSQAGVRTFLNPIKAMTARLPFEEREVIRERLMAGSN